MSIKKKLCNIEYILQYIAYTIVCISSTLPHLSYANHSDFCSPECLNTQQETELFHRINYVLPYYYSTNLNRTALPESTSAMIKNTEFSGQLSLKMPIFSRYFRNSTSLYIAYTQLSYWQLYVKSPYFRDTNYRPEIFFRFLPNTNWKIDLGVEHQSNGRGNHLERSWNRAFSNIEYAKGNFVAGYKPWLLIFKNNSSNLHNPDITHFLGYDQAWLGYRHENLAVNLEVSHLKSLLNRGRQKFEITYRLKPYVYIYAQINHGYGQTLIDYNRESTGYGAGFAFSPAI